LKLLCGYGACDEIRRRCHRDSFYFWHRAGPMARGREPCTAELAAALLAITLRTCSLPSRRIKRLSFALLPAAAVTMATFPLAPRWQRSSLALSVLDVGQGAWLFLVFPAGHTILVGAGGSLSDLAHRVEVRGTPAAGWYSNTAHRQQRRDSRSYR
jgi:hypothetical protein